MILEYKEITELIPHRYPFLLVDRVLEVEPGKKCVAVKNVSANEPFFQGHFPGKPIMPGVLIVEALAQCAGISIALCDEARGKLGLFTGIEKIKFRRQVVPGDVLTLNSEITLFKRGMAVASVIAEVEGEMAAEGQIKFVMVDK